MVEETGQTPRIAVIIPCDDLQSPLTQKCLAAIRANDKSSYRIVAVESRGDEFRYGRSVNHGMRVSADLEFAVVMDSDTFILNNAIEGMVNFLDKWKEVGFCGAWIHKPGTEKIDHVGFIHLGSATRFICHSTRVKAPFFALRRIARGRNWSFGVLGVPEYKPGKMIGVSSAFCAMRRDCYDDVGPWDEGYRSSFVDVDYSYRVMLDGYWKVSSSPASRVEHVGQVTKRKYGHGDFEGLDHYLDKWPKEKIERVLSVSRSGKFLVPEDYSF